MSEDFDVGYELLPEDEAELTADEELELLLADEPDEEEAEERPEAIGRGQIFNFEKGQFHRHGLAPAVAREADHLRIMIEKKLRTARLAHEIYTEDYGVEWPEPLYGVPMTPELFGKVTTAIEEALVGDFGITKVDDIRVDGGLENDLLEISFTVITNDEDTVGIESIPISRRAF